MSDDILVIQNNKYYDIRTNAWDIIGDGAMLWDKVSRI